MVVTVGNNLADPLLGLFQRCTDILGSAPCRPAGASIRASGGVVFNTIHIFTPQNGEAMRGLRSRSW